MRWIFVVLLAVHGLVHLMGFAKAFELAELPQLAQPISRGMGVAWLGAALAMLATAVLFAAGQRGWWAAALAAVTLSQVVIVSSWGDARLGTIANALVLAGVVYGFASQGPLSFRSEYRRAVGERLARSAPTTTLTDEDLAHLPDPVRRYVRLSGAVGQPRVNHFASTWRGRIRGTPEDPWMEFTARQHNFIDGPARLYLMDARRGAFPVDVFHVFREGAATMRVRLLSLFPLVSAAGPELTKAESVTLFNDLCVLAPGALVDHAIEWHALDGRTVEARYTVGENTVGATLCFNVAHELVDFVSDDRLAASADGSLFTRRRWSTPLSDYRDFGSRRAGARGEGRWHLDDGEFVYVEAELLDLRTNAPASRPAGARPGGPGRGLSSLPSPRSRRPPRSS